jgi:hypothetical protein
LAADLAASEEAHADRSVSGERADAGMPSKEADVVEFKGKGKIRDEEEATVVNLNGTEDQTHLQASGSDLQSTMKLGDAVEDDARAVAKSLTTLLASLKAALSEVLTFLALSS